MATDVMCKMFGLRNVRMRACRKAVLQIDMGQIGMGQEDRDSGGRALVSITTSTWT